MEKITEEITKGYDIARKRLNREDCEEIKEGELFEEMGSTMYVLLHPIKHKRYKALMSN